MRRFKTIAFSILSAVIVALFSFEVFAAVYLNITMVGSIDYYSTELGASVWGTYSYDPGCSTGNASYVSFSGGGGTFANNIYEITGNESSYSNITANVGNTSFTSADDELTFYVFIKNTGDRYIIPSISFSSSDTTHIAYTSEMYFFDVSEGNIDPLITKSNVSNATAFASAITTEIDAERCSVFASSSSIDNEDVWCAKITISLQNVTGSGALYIESSFTIVIGLLADVQYTANNILSVYQPENQTDPAWTKFGYNATLNANATKVETNSLSNLYTYLDDADEYGNANITYGVDDYTTAPVYKDIDIVNVDIATGEIIGKLSDLTYDFEWYGRPITLPAGTTLASGRTLSSSETFTVDVYTYYPTMYMRRWLVGNKQWISISDKTFAGAVEISAHYTATFEATTFSPVLDTDGNVTNYTIAYNSFGIVTRSYVYDRAVLGYNKNNYVINNYGYTNNSSFSATVDTTQNQMISWATNLTRAWAICGLDNQYRTATGVQGENWTEFAYNALYLVKYAHNNSQTKVGNGNSNGRVAYNSSSINVINAYGTSITTSGNNSFYEGEIGSGTIGVYNANRKDTATYDSSNNYKMSASGYNAAGLNYGYNSTYTYGTHRQGLFTNQFLTYNTGTKKYLLDGYVGSNNYTSVFCLGKCNPWANVMTWIFGTAVLSDGSNLYGFVSFDNYDYQNPNTSWFFSSPSGGYSAVHTILEDRGYVELSYNLQSSSGTHRYLGTSIAGIGTEKLMIIGLPKKDAGAGGTNTGLCDYYFCGLSTANTCGILVGGATNDGTAAGLFCFTPYFSLTATDNHIGMRTMLK